MSLKTVGLTGSLLLLSATMSLAQDRYAIFFGQYVAATFVATDCKRFTVADVEGAGTIAKSQNGLRKQKVLRILYYGNGDGLRQLGREALAKRGVDAGNTSELCRFGSSVAEKNDTIGRFLRQK